MMLTLRRCLCLITLATANMLSCVDFKPWLPDMYVFEWRNSLSYQTYPSIAKGRHIRKFSSDDCFLNTSLASSKDEYGLELEAAEAFTRSQRGSIDNLRASLRYSILDDIAGDPISLTAGSSYIQAFNWSVKDISSFHHGKYEGELFVSIGKEHAWGEVWVNRWWTAAVIGMAEKGSPWLRLNLGYDFRIKANQECKLFVHTLWGLGSKEIHPDHFKGYGPIQHRSVDLGFRYTYLLEYVGSFSFGYAARVYAYNYPAYAHNFQIEFHYNFGLL